MGSESKTRVVNYRVDKCDTYIGRPTVWGNPFSHKSTGTLAKFVVASRNEAVERYRTYILTQLVQDSSIRQKFETDIRHKVLGCWCKPSSCHGDVLVDIANQLDAGVDFDAQLKAASEPDEADILPRKYRPTPID